MNKWIGLTAIGAVFYLAFGWLIFDFLLGAYTDAHTTQLAGFKKGAEEFSMFWLVVSCTAYAALMVFILVYIGKIRSVLRGTVMAALTGVLVALMADSYWLASSNFYNDVLVAAADIGAAAVTVGAMGCVIIMAHVKLFPEKP